MPPASTEHDLARYPAARADPHRRARCVGAAHHDGVRRRGFLAEAAENEWAHWIDDDDDAPTLRAYASLSDGGPVSITMTSVPIHARLERACVGGRTDLTD